MFNDRLNVGPDPIEDQSLWLQRKAADKLRRQFAASAVMIGEESDHPEQALAALGVVGSLPDMNAAALLLHPAFRYWLQASRRTSTSEFRAHRNRVANDLPSMVWAMASLNGLSDVTWRVVTDERGGLRVLPFGFYLELSDAHASQPIFISTRYEEVEIRTIKGALVGRLAWEESTDGYPVIRPVSGQIEVVSFDRVFLGDTVIDSRDPSLRVKLTGTNQRRNGTDFFAVADELYDETRSAPHIVEAAEQIEQVWPEMARDISLFTHVVVPIWLPPTQRGAFTVSSRQGAIFVGTGGCDEVVEMILHENAHVKLRQIQLMDTLLRDPIDETIKIDVPWRPDSRPVPGVLEGLYVFSHVAEFNLRRPTRHPQLDARMQRLCRDLLTAYDAVASCAQLTDEGERFMEEIGVWIHSLVNRTARRDH